MIKLLYLIYIFVFCVMGTRFVSACQFDANTDEVLQKCHKPETKLGQSFEQISKDWSDYYNCTDVAGIPLENGYMYIIRESTWSYENCGLDEASEHVEMMRNKDLDHNIKQSNIIFCLGTASRNAASGQLVEEKRARGRGINICTALQRKYNKKKYYVVNLGRYIPDNEDSPFNKDSPQERPVMVVLFCPSEFSPQKLWSDLLKELKSRWKNTAKLAINPDKYSLIVKDKAFPELLSVGPNGSFCSN